LPDAVSKRDVGDPSSSSTSGPGRITGNVGSVVGKEVGEAEPEVGKPGDVGKEVGAPEPEVGKPGDVGKEVGEPGPEVGEPDDVGKDVGEPGPEVGEPDDVGGECGEPEPEAGLGHAECSLQPSSNITTAMTCMRAICDMLSGLT
jgi:hypothetical protein